MVQLPAAAGWLSVVAVALCLAAAVFIDSTRK